MNISDIYCLKTSFNNLTQKDCDLITSHINSTSRIILNNKTPYETVQTLISIDTIYKLNIKFINPNQIDLSTNLLKKDYDKNDK